MPCRAPRTVLDFFKPREPGDKAADGPLTAKRKSSDALHEIQVNRGCAGSKQQKRSGEHPFNVNTLTSPLLWRDALPDVAKKANFNFILPDIGSYVLMAVLWQVA